MLRPRRDNPQRDLELAADETRSLGTCMIGGGVLAGTCLSTSLGLLGPGGGVYLLSFVLSCGGFGLFYVYAAKNGRRGKGWAPTAVLAVTGAQAAWLLGFIAYQAWLGRYGVVAGLALASAIWLAALGVVAFHAVRTRRAIRLLMLDEPSGFEVPLAARTAASPERPVPVLQHVRGQQQVGDGVGDHARAQALRVDQQRADHQRPHD